MEYKVTARRIDAHGSLAVAKQAQVVLGTDMAGRQDAFNPVELLLAALAACMIKGAERVTPLLAFQIDGVEVRLEAIRQDAPPKLIRIETQAGHGAGTPTSKVIDERVDLLAFLAHSFGMDLR